MGAWLHAAEAGRYIDFACVTLWGETWSWSHGRVWPQFCKDRGRSPQSLLEAMRQASDEELEEGLFVDRVQRALDRVDIIALIVDHPAVGVAGRRRGLRGR